MQQENTQFKYTAWSHPNGPTIFPLIRDEQGRATTPLKPYLATVQKNPLLKDTPSEVLQAINLFPNLYYELLRLAWRNQVGFARHWAKSPASLYMIAKYISEEEGWREEEAAELLDTKKAGVAQRLGIPRHGTTIRKVARVRDHFAWELLEHRENRSKVFAGRMGLMLRHLDGLITGDTLRIAAHIPVSLVTSDHLLLASKQTHGQCPVFEALAGILALCANPTPSWQWGRVKNIPQLDRIYQKLKSKAEFDKISAAYPPPPLPPDGYFQAIETYQELEAFGRDWQNCAATFHRSLAEGSAAIYFRNDSDEHLRYVVLLKRRDETWQISQVVRPRNRPPSDDMVAEANRWFGEIISEQYNQDDLGPFGGFLA